MFWWFLGERCEINIDDCNEESCKNGGTCEDGINSYSCKCIEGFEGLSKYIIPMKYKAQWRGPW